MHLWGVKSPTFSRQSAHSWRWGCQTYALSTVYPQEDSWYPLSRPQGHSATVRIRSIEKCNNYVGNRIRELLPELIYLAALGIWALRISDQTSIRVHKDPVDITWFQSFDLSCRNKKSCVLSGKATQSSIVCWKVTNSSQDKVTSAVECCAVTFGSAFVQRLHTLRGHNYLIGTPSLCDTPTSPLHHNGTSRPGFKQDSET
jgi:hypothetical protein